MRRVIQHMTASVDYTGRHTVYIVCNDGTFWQFDPHTDTYSEFLPVPEVESKYFHNDGKRKA
jgi:hypothetical protein